MNSIQRLRRQSAIEELNRLDWLEHAEWFDEIDSTNNVARSWFATQQAQNVEADKPALFVADRQTAGRGRSGNQWWSPSGCLMFTLALPASQMPDEIDRYPQLAFVVGVAMAQTVRTLIGANNNASIQLKWPNDVYIDNRKLSGILIETLYSRSQPTGFAIGVGVNAQIDWRDAPEEIAERATCITRVAGRAVECEEVLLEFLPNMESQLAAWCEDSHSWIEAWRERCLLSGKIVRVRMSTDAELTGICEGVDRWGHLLLRDEKQLHSITACEILNWQSID